MTAIGVRRIRGAVLRTTGAARPYAESAPLSIEDLELDPPGPGELLVAIEAASLCHSDLSVVDGSRPRPTPMLLGHEAAGRVVAIGDGVADVPAGRRVVMTFLPRCGGCDACRSGGRLPCAPGSAANGRGELLGGGSRVRAADGAPVFHHLGVSGFATHAVVDRRSVVPIDDDVPADVAAVLGCAVVTGGGALLNAVAAGPDDRVIVVGLGGVGMAAVLTALAIGCREVVAVDREPAKREQAAALGAHRVAAPDDAGELRGDVVVEAVGRGAAFETAFALTAPGGRLVTVGLPAPDDLAAIAPLRLTAEAITIVGSYMGSAVPERDIPRLLDLWRAGRLPLERLISHRIRLDDVNAGMDRLADAAALRQIIDFPQERA